MQNYAGEDLVLALRTLNDQRYRGFNDWKLKCYPGPVTPVVEVWAGGSDVGFTPWEAIAIANALRTNERQLTVQQAITTIRNTAASLFKKVTR